MVREEVGPDSWDLGRGTGSAGATGLPDSAHNGIYLSGLSEMPRWANLGLPGERL